MRPSCLTCECRGLGPRFRRLAAVASLLLAAFGAGLRGQENTTTGIDPRTPIEILRDGRTPAQRIEAAASLTPGSGDVNPAVAEALLEAMSLDPSPEVRRYIVSRAPRMGHAAAIQQALIRVLGNDRDFKVRQAAVTSLIRVTGFVTSIPRLARALRTEEHPEVRASILSGVRRGVKHLSDDARTDLVDELALPRLVRQDSEPEVRLEAIQLLGLIGHPSARALSALEHALNDDRPEVRALAAKALGESGGRSRSMVRALGHALLADPDLSVRQAALRALRKSRPEAELVVPTFAEFLVQDDADVGMDYLRVAAVVAIVERMLTLQVKEPLLPTSVTRLDSWISREDILIERSELNSRVSATAVSALSETLRKNDARLRADAAYALGMIGSESRSAIGDLAATVRSDPEPSVRAAAATALSRMAPDASVAVARAKAHRQEVNRLSTARQRLTLRPADLEQATSALAAALEDPSARVRTAAADGLELMGAKSKVGVPALRRILREEPFSSVRMRAISALASIGSEAVAAEPELLSALREDPRMQVAAINALGKIGSRQAFPDLAAILSERHAYRFDPSTRIAAAEALVAIDSGDAVPLLLTTMSEALPPILPEDYKSGFYIGIQQQDSAFRISLARILAAIGTDAAISGLATILEGTTDPAVRLEIAKVLLGADVQAADDAVTKILQKDDSASVRHGIARTLGTSLERPRFAIETLDEILCCDDAIVAAEALTQLASGVMAEGNAACDRVADFSGLEKVREHLDQHIDPRVNRHEPTVRLAIDYLDFTCPGVVARLRREHPAYFWTLVGGGSYLLAALTTCLLVFWRRPIWLLRFNEAFGSSEPALQMPSWLGKIQVRLRYFLVAGFFQYQPRILDAWVSSHIDTVRKRFLRRGLVRARTLHLATPVLMDGKPLPQLKPEHLRSPLAEPGCLLIWGDGGTGKTSLACQIAGWAMKQKPDERLQPYYVLPVLIEQELVSNDQDQPTLIDAIRGQVKDLTGTQKPVSAELLTRLLRALRLLVIVDGFSEMDAASKPSIQRQLAELPIHALVITSRRREDLMRTTTELNPLKIQADRFAFFISSYLAHEGVTDVKDEDLLKACVQLATLVGKRKTTVLLVKLFADQLIASRNEATPLTLPGTIPDLMVSYVHNLNRHPRRFEDRIVRDAVGAIAWQCLRRSLQPGSISHEAALEVLGGDGAQALLDYLRKDLGIVKEIPPTREKIRFELDPLAEYFAALHLIRQYGDQETLWIELLGRFEQEQDPDDTVEFLLALRDCCLARGQDFDVPEAVTARLRERAELLEGRTESA